MSAKDHLNHILEITYEGHPDGRATRLNVIERHAKSALEDINAVPQQTCWGCRHFVFDLGSDDYSDHTPGEPMEISCLKLHFNLRRSDTTQSDFAEAMEFGFTCQDYVSRHVDAKVDLT